MKNQGRGCVVLSIDVPPAGEISGRLIERNAIMLHELFLRHQLPACWALSDLRPSQLVTALLTGNHSVQPEIALRGDSTWVGQHVGRTHFARQLNQRLEQAAAIGARVSTLALRDVQLDDHLDLLVKHRVNVVFGDVTLTGQSQPQFEPLSLRYGIWQAPAACPIPQRVYGWSQPVTWSARLAVRRCIARGQVAHLWMPGAVLASASRTMLRPIERLLRSLQRACQQQRLRVRTLQQLARELTPVRVAPATRSILRAA